MTAMLLILKNKEGRTTSVLTVKDGERVEFGRYLRSPLPYVRVPPMSGTGNGIVAHEFSGKVVLCNPNGEAFTEVFAEDYMEKEVDNGADN